MSDRRLLVVDDVVELGEAVRTIGGNLGYDVRHSTNGKDFKQAMDDFNPTTVMIDIVLPDIDGFQLVKWLRERGCGAKILVSAMNNLNYAKLARSLGKGRGLDISALPKPYQDDELYEALDYGVGTSP
ncbi:MAG: response regulator [Alphaproteobacteria bacterium]|nr:response regulator [Alphaproteobacteria bacterium]